MKRWYLGFAFLLIAFHPSFGQNNSPVAGYDTINGYNGYSVTVTSSLLLRNDSDPDGDSIYIVTVFGAQKLNDTTWEYNLNYPASYTPFLQKNYLLRDSHGASVQGKLIIRVLNHTRFDYLDINNISALISPFGNHFWDFETSQFEVPKGSGKKAVFNSTLWIGGLDTAGTLHLAAERYRQIGSDFFAGPISTVYDTVYDLHWNRVWKLTKTDIQYHINNWNKPGYVPIEAIRTWPVTGNILNGESSAIAPYFDSNADNNYDPAGGDYPLIRGDETLFFVFNDSRSSHDETKGNKLGIEVYAMAYAYDKPDDSLLNNTIFMHYDVLNKSASAYHDAYIGLFTDFDLGYAMDDYLGCDVTNGMVYDYNGLPIDGTGQPWAYGENPPVIGQKMIGGPLLPADGIDNLSGECGYSLNGMNFGDGVADNERMGLTDFAYFNNGGPDPTVDPEIAIEYYLYMKSMWKDGSHMIFGGNGHTLSGGVGPDCNFMFPGDSDTLCNLGTAGVPPNGGFNQNGYYWTEYTVGNAPGDRHEVASAGPFDFPAGQSVPLDYCYSFARDYSGNPGGALALLRSRISAFGPSFNSATSLPETYAGVTEQPADKVLNIYPNPVTNNVTIQMPGVKIREYRLFAINGSILQTGHLNPGINHLSFGNLLPGVYLLKTENSVTRIIKL